MTSFVLLIIVIVGMTFFYTFSKTKVALTDSLKDELRESVGIVSTQTQGDELESKAHLSLSKL